MYFNHFTQVVLAHLDEVCASSSTTHPTTGGEKVTVYGLLSEGKESLLKRLLEKKVRKEGGNERGSSSSLPS